MLFTISRKVSKSARSFADESKVSELKMKGKFAKISDLLAICQHFACHWQHANEKFDLSLAENHSERPRSLALWLSLKSTLALSKGTLSGTLALWKAGLSKPYSKAASVAPLPVMPQLKFKRIELLATHHASNAFDISPFACETCEFSTICLHPPDRHCVRAEPARSFVYTRSRYAAIRSHALQASHIWSQMPHVGSFIIWSSY